MVQYVTGLDAIDPTRIALVGGKAAHLAELMRLDGVRVPPGFVVTTDAFRHIVAQAPSFDARLERLSRLTPDDREAIAAHSADLRRTLDAIDIPDALATAIADALARLGPDVACAVRSSATAEDLPTASFAGQHETYLDVVGTQAVLEHVRRCWASLFTERAVAYRLRNGIDHRTVHMAVVVQQMVWPQAAGVLFTADPVTSNRKVVGIEAVVGLGDALVSGQVTPDVFAVRDDQVVDRTIAAEQPALTDAQAVQLARLGRRIEAQLGRPQDIEWCLADGELHVVQSRPITTLFPIPGAGDDARHVFVSVGHQQMMTDAMRPLGVSLFQLTSPRPMHEAAGRLFVDVQRDLASPAIRAALLELMGKSDPLLRDALATLIECGEDPEAPGSQTPPGGAPAGGPPPAPPLQPDPTIVTGLIAQTQASLAELQRDIQGKSGPELMDFLLADLDELKRRLFDPQGHRVIMAGIDAAVWLDEHLEAWLGEKNAADTLAQSVPHNVTSEMGLALLDVADAIRPHPDVIAHLERVEAHDDDVLEGLDALAGGRQAREAIERFLERYGMRCAGEIDITRPRWRERPATLVCAILGHIERYEPGEAARRFERGRQEAEAAAQDVLERLRALPDGADKADQTRQKIEYLRTFIGFREFPKYGMVSRYFIYKQALLAEATRLVEDGVLREPDDIYDLSLDELRDVVRTRRADHALIARRRAAFESYRALRPPRVISSDGETVSGLQRRDGLPPNALAGLAASAGVVEGRARVILDMARADLEPGDILVTAFTDPSWTPLFLSVDALVTEVGGLMTHGAVIAREYGLPAVVSVEDATRRIRDGQRIRVHGTDGYVEILG